MITTDTLRLNLKTGDRPPLYLAPFGEPECEAVLPLDLTGLHFPLSHLTRLASTTPEEMTAIKDEEYAMAWGMYTEEVNPAHFVGTITIEQVPDFFGERNKYIKEIGNYVMRPEARGKGIGSLATLAVVAHTLRTDETRLFQAIVSENNKPGQSVLGKVGFAYHGAAAGYIMSDGSKGQQWVLAPPNVHGSLTRDTRLLGALSAGWQRYQTQLQTVDMTVV